MATSHVNLDVNDSYVLPRKVREMITAGLLFRARLRELTAIANTMIDNTDYTMVESQFRCQTGAGATLVGEMNAVLGKIDSDASTDHVLAAMDQLFAKLG